MLPCELLVGAKTIYPIQRKRGRGQQFVGYLAYKAGAKTLGKALKDCGAI